jgi:spore germination protein YaaH
LRERLPIALGQKMATSHRASNSGYLPVDWQISKSRVDPLDSNDIKQSQYGFDGVDFDWEYPGADDRGGSADDGVNFTSLLKELRAAVDKDPHNYIITFTAPTSYWYLRHFDITAMTQYADWINLMAYDLHGVWDSNASTSIAGPFQAISNNIQLGSNWKPSLSSH